MEEILKYFPDLSPTQIERFKQAHALYLEWNAKINVISRKDTDHLWERHFLHSLGIAKVQPFGAGVQVLDVGTGGGFPGIPLAILFPEADFLLIDSIGKKIKVASEVAQSLGLANVKTQQCRAETLSQKFDFIVSRAVTQMPKFVGWVRHNLRRNDPNAGILCLKGGDLQEELSGFNAEEFPLSDYFSEPFFETKKVIYLRDF